MAPHAPTPRPRQAFRFSWPRQAGRSAPRLLAAVLIGAALLPGCRTRTQIQGESRDIVAAYRFRTLTATLPEETRVQAIAAAARAALLDRGYTVRSASATADSARVEGDAPDFGPLDLVVVTAEARAGSGMTVTVRVEPLGDETRSRDILDALLARLAL